MRGVPRCVERLPPLVPPGAEARRVMRRWIALRYGLVLDRLIAEVFGTRLGIPLWLAHRDPVETNRRERLLLRLWRRTDGPTAVILCAGIQDAERHANAGRST